MALELMLSNTQVGASFPNGYARIATVASSRQRGGEHSVMIDLVMYAQEPINDDIREVDFKRYHTPLSSLPAGDNVVAQAYGYLKTLPEFAVATDHLVDTSAPTTYVPQSVTRFQAKAALQARGLLATVETIMADPATPETYKLAWADALTFDRNSATVTAIGGLLNMTAEQLDQLFIEAAAITA